MLSTVADVGEFGLIARIAARLPASPATLVGSGDDAAVVAAADGRTVVTVDVLVDGVHFRRDWSSGYDVGRRAAAASLADVAAMGAVATSLVVGLAAPPETEVAWCEALADGLREECAVVGAAVVGGDVVRSDRLTLSVTALGDLQGRPPVLRSGARPGDDVVLAGRVGWAAAGLALLESDSRSAGALVDAHRRPEPPYAVAVALAHAGATAMCDVSDGLLADLGHIATASGVAVDLDAPAVLAAAGLPGSVNDAARLALTGGDDHAFAATLPAGTDVAGAVRIGRVLAGAGVRVDGVDVSGRLGHDHYLGE